MFNLDSLYMFILPKPQYAFTTGSEPIQLYYTVRERNIFSKENPVGKVHLSVVYLIFENTPLVPRNMS